MFIKEKAKKGKSLLCKAFRAVKKEACENKKTYIAGGVAIAAAAGASYLYGPMGGILSGTTIAGVASSYIEGKKVFSTIYSNKVPLLSYTALACGILLTALSLKHIYNGEPSLDADDLYKPCIEQIDAGNSSCLVKGKMTERKSVFSWDLVEKDITVHGDPLLKNEDYMLVKFSKGKDGLVCGFVPYLKKGDKWTVATVRSYKAAKKLRLEKSGVALPPDGEKRASRLEQAVQPRNLEKSQP